MTARRRAGSARNCGAESGKLGYQVDDFSFVLFSHAVFYLWLGVVGLGAKMQKRQNHQSHAICDFSWTEALDSLGKTKYGGAARAPQMHRDRLPRHQAMQIDGTKLVLTWKTAHTRTPSHSNLGR